VSLAARPAPSPARDVGLASAALFLAATLLHVLVWWQYRSDPFSLTYVSDALAYDRQAARIATDGWSGEPVFHQPPLFPLLLSWIYAAVPEPARAAWCIGMQVLLSASAIACLVPLGRAWLGSLPAGVAAASLACLHAPFAFYSMKLLPTPLTLFTQGVGLLLLARARDAQHLPSGALAGIAWGLACLTRSEALLFVPVAAAALASSRARSRRLAIVAAYLGGLAIALAPVVAHNWLRGDQVLVCSSAGENLFIGNQRGAQGGYTPLDPRAGDIFSQRVFAERRAEEALGRELAPSEVSAYWARRARAEVAADPAAWAWLELAKLGRLLSPGDTADIYSLTVERAAYLPALYALFAGPWTILWLGAIGVGLALRGRVISAWPLVGLIAVQSIVLLLFFVDARLRLPLFYVLCPFAGLAAVEGWRRWRSGRSRRTTLILAATVGLTVVAGFGSMRPTPRDVLRLSSVLSMQQRLDESLEVLAPFLGADPDPGALDQAGWVLHKRGDYEQAQQRYQAALESGLPPGREHQTRTRLGIVLERLGRFDEASAQHDAAVASGQANAGTHYERGTFLLRRGETLRAVEDLRQAVRLDPGWAAPRMALEAAGAAPG